MAFSSSGASSASSWRGWSCRSSGAAPYCSAISSVTNGMKGCSRRTIWSSIQRACPATCAFLASSSPYSGTLMSSRYQSQNSSQTKWYSASTAAVKS